MRVTGLLNVWVVVGAFDDNQRAICKRCLHPVILESARGVVTCKAFAASVWRAPLLAR